MSNFNVNLCNGISRGLKYTMSENGGLKSTNVNGKYGFIIHLYIGYFIIPASCLSQIFILNVHIETKLHRINGHHLISTVVLTRHRP